MNPSKGQCVLVYDVGGSHVSAAVCDEGTYAMRGLSRAPLPAEGKAHFSAASFCRLIHTLGEAAAAAGYTAMEHVSGAALAMPGPFDYRRGISQMTHKLPGLLGVDLKTALAKRFGWEAAQVRFVNDAAAYLLGEVGAGAAKGFSRSIGITLGTGIGCAFAVDGRVVTEGDGVPPGGEIWNLPFAGATVEDFVSTRYLRQQYQSLTGLEAEVSAIADAAGGHEDCPELQGEQKGHDSPVPDPNDAHCRARQAFLDFGRNLGLALNQHAAAFRPDVIVFGGGISRASHLFLPATRSVLQGIHAQLAISALMDEAALAGAGVRWFTAP